MFSIEEINEMLNDIAEEFPEELFRELNGGVSLLPDVQKSASDPDGELYRLGEYRRDQMGRYIVIYYGSICTVHGHLNEEAMRKCLKDLLSHELTHHMESLSGTRDLEIKDKRYLENYFRRKRKRNRE